MLAQGTLNVLTSYVVGRIMSDVLTKRSLRHGRGAYNPCAVAMVDSLMVCFGD